MRGHRGAVGWAYTHVEDGANVRCIVRAEANDAVVRRTPAATGRVGRRAPCPAPAAFPRSGSAADRVAPQINFAEGETNRFGFELTPSSKARFNCLIDIVLRMSMKMFTEQLLTFCELM